MTLFLMLAAIFSAPTEANILKLLDCYIEGAPVPYLTVYSYQGLWTVTTDRDGVTLRERLADQDFDRRLIPIVQREDMKGMLFREDGEWRFSFKGPGGWYMSGPAYCQQ